MIPRATKEAIDRWVKDGIEPGSFVRYVLENNLVGAFAAADERNLAAMFDIVSYVFNHVPSPAWGSPEKLEAWAEKVGRLKQVGVLVDSVPSVIDD